MTVSAPNVVHAMLVLLSGIAGTSAIAHSYYKKIPYKGGPQALNDVMSGQVALYFAGGMT